MNKETVKNIILGKQVSISDYYQFITDYIKEKSNKEITSEQLQTIAMLLQQNVFDMNFVINESIRILNLDVSKLIDLKSGNIIKIYIHE